MFYDGERNSDRGVGKGCISWYFLKTSLEKDSVIPWTTLVIPGNPWYYLVISVKPWKYVVSPGSPCYSLNISQALPGYLDYLPTLRYKKYNNGPQKNYVLRFSLELPILLASKISGFVALHLASSCFFFLVEISILTSYTAPCIWLWLQKHLVSAAPAFSETLFIHRSLKIYFFWYHKDIHGSNLIFLWILNH